MASTARVRLWRWRANPLKRRSDRAEAWVVLLAFLLVTLGGATTAVVTWFAVRDGAAEQRAEGPHGPGGAKRAAGAEPRETVYTAPRADTTWVLVRWTAPWGTERHGTAESSHGDRAGAAAPGRSGQDGDPEPGTVTAVLHAALASGTFIGLVCAAQAGLRARIDRRRVEAWERAWAETEPRWRHSTP